MNAVNLDNASGTEILRFTPSVLSGFTYFIGGEVIPNFLEPALCQAEYQLARRYCPRPRNHSNLDIVSRPATLQNGEITKKLLNKSDKNGLWGYTVVLLSANSRKPTALRDVIHLQTNDISLDVRESLIAF
ncbi:unnamed protein product [Phytophthora fragariaefolia]|uniref:Unnamed protein product n=1 Tax=Phytophthora fragariaefolia TaxID=1490495 RepID=A0A9W6XZZ0_9STRA|nr:unnamed protein product [Phytophthora fragariaefolia]